jgi:hypothetical protein
LRSVYELVPVIADVIRAHCPGSARADFMQACLHGQWHEARSMVEGMLAEPWFLRGYQENRLREFLELLPVTNMAQAPAPRRPLKVNRAPREKLGALSLLPLRSTQQRAVIEQTVNQSACANMIQAS